MNIEDNFERYGMAVPSYEARRDREFVDDNPEYVEFTPGLIPAKAEVVVVRCPFETLIQSSEQEVSLCRNAEKCKLEGALDLCEVKHLHNFFSPGEHPAFPQKTLSKGFSTKIALERVSRVTSVVRKMKIAGFVVLPHKKAPRRWKAATTPAKSSPATRLESHSVYEFNTTPPAVPKTEIIETRADVWDRKHKKESKRIAHIQLSRFLKAKFILEESTS